MVRGKNLDFGAMLAVYGGILTKRQREIAELYYWEDLSLAEISENLGITRQAVRDGVKHSEQRLTEIDEGLGLLGKITRCEEAFEGISEAAEGIAGQQLSADTLSAVDRIKALAKVGRDIF